jgi:hypothetical protein
MVIAEVRTFRPFHLFNGKLLDAFTRSGKRYFVRQSFNCGFAYKEEGIRAYFIISHYADLAAAQEHFDVVAHDSTRFLYDWQDPEHRKKLILASKNPDGYRIYANVFQKNWIEQITPELKDKARRYIQEKLHWRPTRFDHVHFLVESRYGELYARIQTRHLEACVKFEEIEDM